MENPNTERNRNYRAHWVENLCDSQLHSVLGVTKLSQIEHFNNGGFSRNLGFNQSALHVVSGGIDIRGCIRTHMTANILSSICVSTKIISEEDVASIIDSWEFNKETGVHGGIVASTRIASRIHFQLESKHVL